MKSISLFGGSNRILMANNLVKNISDLKKGDLILGVNSNGEFTQEEIINIISEEVDSTQVRVVGDIICNSYTEFWNPELKRFSKTVELKGDKSSNVMALIEGKLVRIPNAIYRLGDHTRTMYHIETLIKNAFIVNDIIVR